MESWFVCLLGMGVVFTGLFILVLVCMLMGAAFKNTNNKPQATVATPAPAAAPAAIPNKQELIAAVSAAIAEELGEDISAIRITSIRRI